MSKMRREIAAVVFFLKRLTKKGGKVEEDKVELFFERLAVALQDKFKGHWYPETPSKGQAYRCIRVNMFHRRDPELLRACRESGVKYGDLALPRELTLWVDPGEVCCRYREHNPCFSVATFTRNDEEDIKVAKKATSAFGWVTSDYHSGSSSDESSPITISNRRCTHQTMNPEAPSWYPKKMPQNKGPIAPQAHYGYRAHSRAAHITSGDLWTPPVYRGAPDFWDPSPVHRYS